MNPPSSFAQFGVGPLVTLAWMLRLLQGDGRDIVIVSFPEQVAESFVIENSDISIHNTHLDRIGASTSNQGI